MFDHSRLGLESVLYLHLLLHHNVAFTSLSNIAPFERLDNWTTPKHNFTKHTRHDSPWWQPIYTLHSSI